MTSIPDDLIVSGRADIGGPVRVTENNVSLLQGLDSRNNMVQVLNLDGSGTLEFGSGNDPYNMIMVNRPMFGENLHDYYHFMRGKPQGLEITPIGNGIYTPTFLPTGQMVLRTKGTAGDGCRLNFGNMGVTLADSTQWYAMFNADTSSNVDMQYGFRSTTGAAEIRMRYSSGPGGGNWVCSTLDGNGGESNTPLPAYADGGFRRALQIRFKRIDAVTPANVEFYVGDSNNEFRLGAVHTYAIGSLPGVTDLMVPFAQFRTGADEEHTFKQQHYYAIYQRM